MWWSRSFPSCGSAIPGNSGCSPASRQTGEEVNDTVYSFLNHVSPGVASIRCSHPTGKLSHLLPSWWKEGWGMRSLYRHSFLSFHLLFFLYLLNSYSCFKALLCLSFKYHFFCKAITDIPGRINQSLSLMRLSHSGHVSIKRHFRYSSICLFWHLIAPKLGLCLVQLWVPSTIPNIGQWAFHICVLNKNAPTIH